ncbi:MAG: outer membrane protein assembly factor BamD, partial [Thalassobaculaceae bacterium]
AIAALDRFIKLNPGNPNAAYALYLKGLCYYEQITDVGRDQTLTRQAMRTFESLIARFPENPYTRDARLKVDLTRNHLAGKEMAIGRFYAARGQYLAAINRFRQVVDTYDTTDQVPEALHRLTEMYLALGLDAEARKAAAVLGHNYPGSPWYVDSYRLVTGDGDGEADGKPGLAQRLWSGFKDLF